MRIDITVSEMEIHIRRSMCDLENTAIERIQSLEQSLNGKTRNVQTKQTV